MIKTISVGEVEALLEQGYTVKVKSLNNEFIKITKYINKGILDTYKIILENGKNINTSLDHMCFTNAGWVMTRNLLTNVHSILCEDNTYSIVVDVQFIGKHKIVDITVDHPDESYFGNGILNHNSGKSLLVAHIMAETQKRDGIAVIIDTEFATDKDFLAAVGVDLSKLIYINDSILENAFEIIENIVETVRKNNSDRLICIAIDSIMGATDESEDESDWSKTGYATQKARVLGKAMRKITSLIAKHRIALVLTNQLRAKLNAMFGDPWTTSGGKAIPFHSSLRLRLQQLNQLKIKDKVVGIKTRVKVVKSRLGSMYNTCSFDIYFDRGIDTVSTWFDVGKLHKLIIPAKKLEDETQPESKTNKYKEVKGQYMLEGDPEMNRFQLPSFKETVLDVPELKHILYEGIAEAVLLKYRDINKNPINREEVIYGTGQDED